MEKVTFGSIGNYIVAAKDGKMLFNHQIVPNLVAAGEAIHGDKRVLIKTYKTADIYKFLDSLDITDISDIDLDTFTEEVPVDIIKFYGRYSGYIKIDERYYIEIREIESDFAYYELTTKVVKYINANNKIESQSVYKDTIGSLFPSDDKELAKRLPNQIKWQNCTHYIDDGLSLHAISNGINIYFTTGDYLTGLKCNKYCNTVKNKNKNIFYVGQNGRDLELIELDGEYRATLTKNHEHAARLPGFGQLTLLNADRVNIEIGENTIGNVVICSDVDAVMCRLYSIVDPNGCEHVFGIGFLINYLLKFKHRHLPPTKTKTVNVQSQIAIED